MIDKLPLLTLGPLPPLPHPLAPFRVTFARELAVMELRRRGRRSRARARGPTFLETSTSARSRPRYRRSVFVSMKLKPPRRGKETRSGESERFAKAVENKRMSTYVNGRSFKKARGRIFERRMDIAHIDHRVDRIQAEEIEVKIARPRRNDHSSISQSRTYHSL